MRNARARAGHGRTTARLLAAVALASSVLTQASSALAEDKPSRIVSINMCTDELLLRLADPARVASVTWLSQNSENANMAEAARKVPANHGLAEEVMSFHPDLVLAGAFTTRSTIQLLRRMGIKVVEFGVPKSLEAVREQIRRFAATIGEQERGDALVAQMDARLAALATDAHSPRLSAIVLRPNGITVGKDSLVNELLEHAGLTNLATRLGIENYLQIPLESVALQKADVLILSDVGEGPPSLATEALHHPIVEQLGSRLKVVSMPSRLWTCPGPEIVTAVQRLREQTARSSRGAPPSQGALK